MSLAKDPSGRADGAQAAQAYSPDRPRVDMWRRIAGGLLEVHRCLRWSGASLLAVCVGQALLYQQFGDLFAVARRFKAFAEHQAFGHSQTAEAASFQRELFTPGADEFL